jgi:hypothetical protein
MKLSKFRFVLIAISGLILIFSCKKKSINCGLECSEQTEELLFQSGFEGTTLTKGEYFDAYFSGMDANYTEKSSWEEFEEHDNIGFAKIGYEDGSDDQRLASIVEDPDSAGNEVLKFQIMEPHIKEGSKKKGRVQLNVSQNNCIKEIYQTIKLKLHPDLAHLKNWQERFSWFSLFEFWNNADWTREKYPFRVTVNLFKEDEGVVDNLYFHAKGDYKKNCKNCKWHKEWEQTGDNFAVPFGKWMEIEMYIKEGDSGSGRFYMAVTPEDGDKVVVFDIANTTQHPKEKCADGFTHTQPLKLYTSDKTVNFMKDVNKELVVYWDDWKFYKNKQP